MAEIRFRGKDRNHFTVGNGKLFDIQSLNLEAAAAAVVARGDAAIDNRYRITLTPGEYPLAAIDELQHCDIVFEAGAVIRHTAADDEPTLKIDGSTATVSDVRFIDARVVNENDAGAPAVQLGPSDALVDESATSDVRFDGIVFERLRAESWGIGLSILGCTKTEAIVAGVPRVELFASKIGSCKTAFCGQGNFRLDSLGNHYLADPDGVGPYTDANPDTATADKTAFRFNAVSEAARGDLYTGESRLTSNGDLFEVFTRDKGHTFAGNGVSAFRIDGTNSGSEITSVPRVTVLSPIMDVVLNGAQAGAGTRRMAIILLRLNWGNQHADDLRFLNVSGKFHQPATGSWAKDMAAVLTDGTATTYGIKPTVTGHFDIIDAAGTLTNAWTLWANGALDDVNHYVTAISGGSKNTGASGTYSALTPLA